MVAIATIAFATPARAAREVSAHDITTLKNAWIVYPGYGSYHLRNGSYESPAHTFGITLFERAGMIAVEGSRAATLSGVVPAGPGAILYLSLFTRTADGFFRNDATVAIGRGVRPLSLTMHGNRLRLSVVQPGGRQATLIYHMTGRGLTAAATRHEQ